MICKLLHKKNIFFFLSFFFLSSKALLAHEKSFVIGSLGDSITTGTNTKGWGERRRSNWSTGSDQKVDSHFLKLKNFIGDNVKAFNVAKSGATSHDLERQTTELLKHNPDYVTLLVGANDVCGWGDDHNFYLKAFKKRVQDTVEKLVNHNSEVKILIAPVPDMYHLWQLGSNSSCQFLWDMAGACKRLLHSRTSQATRLKFKEQLKDLNHSLSEIAGAHTDHVRFDVSLSEYKFKKEDISRADCFHPSIQGQKLISDMTWRAGWFN